MARSHKTVATGRAGSAAGHFIDIKASSATKIFAASALSHVTNKTTSSTSPSLEKLEILDLSVEQANRIEEICASDAKLPAVVRDAISKPWKASRG